MNKPSPSQVVGIYASCSKNQTRWQAVQKSETARQGKRNRSHERHSGKRRVDKWAGSIGHGQSGIHCPADMRNQSQPANGMVGVGTKLNVSKAVRGRWYIRRRTQPNTARTQMGWAGWCHGRKVRQREAPMGNTAAVAQGVCWGNVTRNQQPWV